jgi:hypothetical protein
MIIFAIGIINIIDDKTKLIQEWMIIIEHTEKSINNILD